MSHFLLVGDLHFKVSNKLETDLFEKNLISFLETESRIDKIILLGDILDTFEKIHSQVLFRAVEFIKNISKFSHIVVLIGNHDRINNDVFMTPVHPFVGLKSDKILIVYETVRLENFIFVPYVPNGRFSEALQHVNFPEKTCKAIFAHQEFKGCKMGAFISETGDCWSENFPEVFSGHIHESQKINNIFYTGVPFPHGFGDSDEKFIFLLDKETLNKEKVKIPYVEKKIIRMSEKEFLEYQVNENEKIKVIFPYSPTLKDFLQKREIKNKLKNNDIKFSIETEKKKNITKVAKEESFLEILQKKIKNSKEKEILEKICK